MATRKPVRVLPDPVGAAIRVSTPDRMRGHPSAWGAVGPSGKRRANQEAMAGWKPVGVDPGARGAHPAQGTGGVWRGPPGIPVPTDWLHMQRKRVVPAVTGAVPATEMTMAELNQTLPLLPLTSGVALPGMVFTLALETDEARAAADAAGAAGGRLVLVPHVDGRYASIGVVAEIVEVGDLPGGTPGHGRPRRRARHHRDRRPRHRDRPVGPGRTRSPRVPSRPRRPNWPASTGPSSRTSSSPAAPAGWPSGCAR